MQIGSLFMALGFDVDDKKLDQFSGKIKGLRGGLVGVAGVAAAGVGALSAMAITGAKSANELSMTASAMDETTESIQRFHNVASQTNPALEISDSIAQLKAYQKALVDAEWSQGAIGTMALLDIDPRNTTPVEFERRIAEAYQNPTQDITRPKLLSLLNEAGADNRFVKMLELTNAEYDKLAQRDIVTKEDIERLLSVGVAMEDLGHQAGLLTKELGALTSEVLVPAINGISDGVEFLRKDVPDALVGLKQWSADMDKSVSEGFDYLFSKESLADFSNYMRGENERLSLQRIKEEEPERFKDIMVKKYVEGQRTTTNNINIESTAEAGDLVESLFDSITYQENISTANELPNTSRGGIR